MPTVAQHYVSPRGSAEGRKGFAPGSSPVVLMVSGGADSTALLLMALSAPLDIDDGRGRSRIARERLHVLHVNHHLRAEASDGDEEFVRELCRIHGLPLRVVHASFADIGSQNLEAAAREVRYRAARAYVSELCEEAGVARSAARILTAHTASDRCETFFMNAIKGSGPAGLSSIPRRRGIIVRPLLDLTHQDLEGYLRVRGQEWREDESNKDTSYLRNFIRRRILPLARERNGRIEATVGAACDILGAEDAFMTQLSATSLRACIKSERPGLLVLDARRMAGAEMAIARRMVRAAALRLEPDMRLEMQHVERVLSLVAAGEGSCTLPGGLDARVEYGALFLRTPCAREELVASWLGVPGRVPLANGCMLASEFVAVPADDPVAYARAQSERGIVLVDAAALGYSEGDLSRIAQIMREPSASASVTHVRLWVDAPCAGDAMCPLGMSGRSKKLSDVLNAAKVPASERASVPVVRTAPAGAVVWVAGVRLDERFKVRPTTRFAVGLKLQKIV